MKPVQKFHNANTQPSFKCAHCKNIDSHKWNVIYSPFQVHQNDRYYSMGSTTIFIPEEEHVENGQLYEENLHSIIQSTCTNCEKDSYWMQSLDKTESELLIYPQYINDFPEAHVDMPADILKIYNEAGAVSTISLSSSAALSRLAIEKILTLQGYTQDFLVKKIKAVIDEKKVNSETMKTLQILRNYGNEGVHTGELDLSEDEAMPIFLLDSINLIVEEFISKPKRIQDRFDKLPPSFTKGIDNI